MEVSTETAIRSSCRHVMMPVNEHVSCAKRQVRPLPKGCKPRLGWRSCCSAAAGEAAERGTAPLSVLGAWCGVTLQQGCSCPRSPEASREALQAPRCHSGLAFVSQSGAGRPAGHQQGATATWLLALSPRARWGAAGTLYVCVPAPRQRGSSWIPQTRGAWAAPHPRAQQLPLPSRLAGAPRVRLPEQPALSECLFAIKQPKEE